MRGAGSEMPRLPTVYTGASPSNCVPVPVVVPDALVESEPEVTGSPQSTRDQGLLEWTGVWSGVLSLSSPCVSPCAAATVSTVYGTLPWSPGTLCTRAARRRGVIMGVMAAACRGVATGERALRCAKARSAEERHSVPGAVGSWGVPTAVPRTDSNGAVFF